MISWTNRQNNKLGIVEEEHRSMKINKSIKNALNHTIGHFEEIHSIIVKSAIKEKTAATHL